MSILASRFSGDTQFEVERAVVAATLVGLFVARVVFVLQHLPSYSGNFLQMLDFRDAGFAAISGIDAGIVAAFDRHHRRPANAP